MQTFNDLHLPEALLKSIADSGYTTPTPIQAQAIPLAVAGRDLQLSAQTGSGKTAAFVLPILTRLIESEQKGKRPRALILTPTRELALQVHEQVRKYGKELKWLFSVPLVGGAPYGGQIRALKKGVQIIIATPGRLISHLNMGSVDLSRTSFFVLDEADRMLDMGFHDDIMQIYKQLPETCQVVMFSATMPPKIRTLAHNILKNPEEIKIAVSRPPESIMQTAYICYEAHKMPLLKQLFAKKAPERVIIFSSSKMKVKELAATLKRMNFNVAAMHSDLEQSEREQVMKDFRNGHISMLVATDVVARGIDINDISLVINYDIPNDPEDYVHRIGRTARGTEGSGLAITFVSQQEQARFKEIETFIEKDIYKIPIDPSIGESPTYEPEKYSRSRGKGGRGRQSGGGGGRAKAQSTSSKPRGGGNRRRNKPSQNRPAHS